MSVVVTVWGSVGMLLCCVASVAEDSGFLCFCMSEVIASLGV